MKKDEARKEKDSAYALWEETKNAKKAKLDEFRKNRDFSKEVRSHVTSGNFEEAIELCRAQTEEMMHQFKDKNYRKEVYRYNWRI